MSCSKLLLTIFAMAAIGGGGESHAAAVPHVLGAEVVSVRVRLGDLDLANPAGAAVALRRIHHAASEICGPDPEMGDLTMRDYYRACINGAVDRAVDRLGSAVVSALNGHPSSAFLAANSR